MSPLPRRLAQMNRVVTNRAFGPLAGRVPPWVVVEHRGRRSGRMYRTVVWAFPHGQDLIFALTYGPQSDWVRNVLQARGARVRWRGRWRAFDRVELLQGAPGLRWLQGVIRPFLSAAGMHSVLRMSKQSDNVTSR